MQAELVEWIGVDWGAASFRAWAFDANGSILDQTYSDKGTSKLEANTFEAALLDAVEPWLSGKETKVICCGNVGVKQGWHEAHYTPVPAAPICASTTACLPIKDERLSVHILPGMSQESPADVMCGEETQIAGFLAQSDDFDGTICLAGTHTKWAQLSAGEVVSFRTFMSGELFACLSEHSVLKYSIGQEGWDDQCFFEAIDDAMTSPQNIAAKLFGIRAESLLSGLEPAKARARLSGYLIGLELKAARPYWLGNKVALIGTEQLTKLYASVLESQSVPVSQHDIDDMTIAGLKSAFKNLDTDA